MFPQTKTVYFQKCLNPRISWRLIDKVIGTLMRRCFTRMGIKSFTVQELEIWKLFFLLAKQAVDEILQNNLCCVTHTSRNVFSLHDEAFFLGNFLPQKSFLSQKKYGNWMAITL